MAATPKIPAATIPEIVQEPRLAERLSTAEITALLGTCEAGRAVLAAVLASRAVPPVNAPDNGAAGLLTAAELAEVLKVKRSWVETAARYDEIPCVRAGRYVRFNLAEVEAALRAKAREE